MMAAVHSGVLREAFREDGRWKRQLLQTMEQTLTRQDVPARLS